jgi:hypothetical protein
MLVSFTSLPKTPIPLLLENLPESSNDDDDGIKRP